MFAVRVGKTLLIGALVFFSVFLALILLPPSSPFPRAFLGRAVCRHLQWFFNDAALPAITNGYLRVDCYGGLNQMRRDFCDGVGIARMLNATLVLPKFEVAAYWNETSGFGDVFDVEYFIQQMNGFIHVVKKLPAELALKEPVQVDCSKRKGLFDYAEIVLPSLLEHHYISITPAMSQRRDRLIECI